MFAVNEGASFIQKIKLGTGNRECRDVEKGKIGTVEPPSRSLGAKQGKD